MRLFAAIALVSLLSCNSINGQSGSPKPEPAATPGTVTKTPLDGVLKEVQSGLQRAQDVLTSAGLPALQSVQLTLHTEVSKDAKLGIKVFVFTVGGGKGASNAQELVLTLVPPKARTTKGALPAFAPQPTAADAIVSLIEAAAQAVDTARKGSPPLEPENLTLSLVFSVTEVVGGGLKFDVGVVSVDAGGNVRNLSEQRIRITFK